VHHIGEIQLALGVVGLELADQLGEQGAVEGIDAGIDLADLAGGGVGVAVLHDRGDRPGVGARDPAVPGRVRDDGSEHGDRVARPLVLRGEGTQRLAAQQRHIAVADDHGAGQRAGDRQGALDGVPGALLLVLDCGGDGQGGEVGGAGQILLHLLATVADHRDQALR